MKILNISSIIPLKGLKLENDIVIKLQDYLSSKYGYEFTIAKSLPYVNKQLAKVNKRWSIYYEYHKSRMTMDYSYQIFIYPWLAPPSSNFWLNYLLLPINWVWFKIKNQKRFLITFKDTDLILAQNLMPDAIYAYWLHRKFQKPYIIFLRGVFYKNIRSLPLFRSVFNNASRIITHSPTHYSTLKRHVNLEFIPHPIEDIFFNNIKKDYKILKLITVCRLLTLKHIDWVLEALAYLQKKGYNFEFIIVGDGPELNNLKKIAISKLIENKIIFKGLLSHSEIRKLLAESNVFIMPSYPETLGRAFLEAAASECLCIGHEKTGIDGLFSHYKSAVFVNKETLKFELEKLFENFNSLYFDPLIKEANILIDDLTWINIGEKYNQIFSNSAIKEG